MVYNGEKEGGVPRGTPQNGAVQYNISIHIPVKSVYSFRDDGDIVSWRS